MGVNKNNVKIHISHLKKNFGKLEVLKDVSTDIYEGEVVVILGPSGSGKSTLLRCLNRLEEITGGEVIVDNPYNDWETAMHDLAIMHISYLNEDYDRGVLEKWAAATVEEEGCYQGMDGLSYAERHLQGPYERRCWLQTASRNY